MNPIKVCICLFIYLYLVSCRSGTKASDTTGSGDATAETGDGPTTFTKDSNKVLTYESEGNGVAGINIDFYAGRIFVLHFKTYPEPGELDVVSETFEITAQG